MTVNIIFGRRPAARQVQANPLSFCFVLMVLIYLFGISPCDTSCNLHVSSSLLATGNATIRAVGAKPSNSEAVQNMSSAGCLGVATHLHVHVQWVFLLLLLCVFFCCFFFVVLLNTRIVSWPSVEISATTTLPPRGVFTHNHITLFTGTTQDCATALLVVGPSPQGVSQLRYRLQLRCLHEAFH